MTWWYLSFAGPEGWRGGAIVQADGFILAVQVTHALGINPGGQVKGHALDSVAAIGEHFRNVLLSQADLLRLDTEAGEPEPEVVRW